MKKILAALLSLCILLLAAPAQAADTQTPSGISLDDMEAFIDDYVSGFIGKTSPGLAVAVVKDGKLVFSKGYGFADIENKIPVNSASTVFEYGSVSKLFVYTAVMQLADDGKLDLDTDIRSYLPDSFLKNLRYDQPVTLMHVMNHTTGFEDHLFDVVVTSQTRRGFEDILQNAQPQQVYPPGTVSAYSNYAVALAAYIVQRIAGQDFYDYLTDNVLLPSGMGSTSAHPELSDKLWLLEYKARGYYPAAGDGFIQGDWSYIPLYPVGALNGTAEDLARFAIALMPSECEKCTLFKNNATLRRMFTQSHAMGPGLTGFAHGFIEYDGSLRGLGHGGNTAFFSAQMNIVPEERFGVIVLSNAAGEMDLTQGLTQALLGKRLYDAPGKDILPDAGEVNGTYIPARRAHNGFLKLYGYFFLLEVDALDADTIQLRYAGQSATLVQTEPYVFRQIEADGPIFRYNFQTVYFDMKDGAVQRVSGDFLPLSGSSVSWLVFDGIGALVCMLFFLCMPLVFLVQFLRRKKCIEQNEQARHARRFYKLSVLAGTALAANNLALVLRMLINNYRSFSEVRLHILLNYPVAFAAAVLMIITAVLGIKAGLKPKQVIGYVLSAVLLALLIGLLQKWDFFYIFV